MAGDYYHLYNRGVEKRRVFMDSRDYRTFIGFPRLYLLPPDPWTKRHKDLSEQVELAAYCLMPNHFHLLVRQIHERGIEMFMRCLATAYVGYFNRRHRRVGSLFQDSYKAVRIRNEVQLFQVEQYIHANPRKLDENGQYPYSSSRWGSQKPGWLQPIKA